MRRFAELCPQQQAALLGLNISRADNMLDQIHRSDEWSYYKFNKFFVECNYTGILEMEPSFNHIPDFYDFSKFVGLKLDLDEQWFSRCFDSFIGFGSNDKSGIEFLCDTDTQTSSSGFSETDSLQLNEFDFEAEPQRKDVNEAGGFLSSDSHDECDSVPSNASDSEQSNTSKSDGFEEVESVSNNFDSHSHSQRPTCSSRPLISETDVFPVRSCWRGKTKENADVVQPSSVAAAVGDFLNDIEQLACPTSRSSL